MSSGGNLRDERVAFISSMSCLFQFVVSSGSTSLLVDRVRSCSIVHFAPDAEWSDDADLLSSLDCLLVCLLLDDVVDGEELLPASMLISEERELSPSSQLSPSSTRVGSPLVKDIRRDEPMLIERKK